MAVRQNQLDDQLDLFANQRLNNEAIDPIRQTGRETLARTSSQNGARTGTEGTPAPDASRSRGKDEGQNGHVAPRIDEAGQNGATGQRPGLGNGAGKIHSAASGNGLTDSSPKNLNSYRISDDDRLGT